LKFTLKINNIPLNKPSKTTEKLALISSLPAPILAKSSKKVKDIAIYFKKNDNSKGKETSKKPYTQTLSRSQEVNFISIYFLSYFHFHFDLFLIFDFSIFRILRVRVRSDQSQH